MNFRISQLFILATTFLLNACVSYDELIYLQSNEEGTLDSVAPSDGASLGVIKGLSDYKLKPSDNLFINVNSFQETTTDFLNQSGDQVSANSTTSQIYLSSYAVNDSGFIKLPLIGNVYVDGFTLQEVQEKLKSELVTFIRQPSVSVKLANFRITILGEVLSPGSFNIYDEKMNLVEVIGLAGGLTDYANIKKIKIVRKKGDGYYSKYIDMSTSDIIFSEYFYILPDDVIYVEPLKAKSFTLNIRPISLLLGIASLSTTVLATVILTNSN